MAKVKNVIRLNFKVNPEFRNKISNFLKCDDAKETLCHGGFIIVPRNKNGQKTYLSFRFLEKWIGRVQSIFLDPINPENDYADCVSFDGPWFGLNDKSFDNVYVTPVIVIDKEDNNIADILGCILEVE